MTSYSPPSNSDVVRVVPPPLVSEQGGSAHGPVSTSAGNDVTLPPPAYQPQDPMSHITPIPPIHEDGGIELESVPAPEGRRTIRVKRAEVCPNGGIHDWSPNFYPTPAWLTCIMCFPCGILCCLKMKETACRKCGLIKVVGEETDNVDPETQAKRDAAFRIGFAIGAIQTMIRP